MGRTVPTFRQLIEEAIARWSKFRRALRREDQEYFDRLFRRVRSYTQAATYQASDNPMEAILLSVALDQEKRLDALERAVLPEKVVEELDAARIPNDRQFPKAEPLPGADAERKTIAGPGANSRMDLRSLSLPAGDEIVVDRVEQGESSRDESSPDGSTPAAPRTGTPSTD